MKTFTNVLQAHCRVCSSTAVAQRFLTFAYWHCPQCKDEVDVKLHTTLSPRGELYAYSPNKEDALTISEPGVYLLTYVNGTYEWYEHHAGTRDLKLHRTLVQSATRTPDRDLPSRKQVQQASSSGEGAEDEGSSLRTLSDASYSLSGIISPASLAKAIQASHDQAWIDTFKLAFPSSASGSLSSGTKTQVRNLAKSGLGIQHGVLPPDDDL